MKIIGAFLSSEDHFIIYQEVTFYGLYWDYLGKPDPMALPEAKVRQAAYVEQMGLRAPYTPQSFYDGAKQCPGTKRNQVEANIRLRQTGDEEIKSRLLGLESAANEVQTVQVVAPEYREIGVDTRFLQ